MTKKFLKEITKKLQEEEVLLEAKIGRTVEAKTGEASADSLFPSYGDKEDENAAEVATFEANLAVEGSLEQAYRDVKDALAKVANGTYGMCETCGQPIAIERLQAFPTARQCLKCKAKQG